VFADVFERNLTVGKIEETRDIYKSKYCRVSHDISPEWHLKIQAAWQEQVDGGISKTINMPHDATFRDVRDAYMTAWKNNVKGITCYRDLSKDNQVLFRKPSCSGEECML
jgi:ribonucleoside-diphosphate reductase alpha chain